MFYYRQNSDGSILDAIEFKDGEKVPQFIIKQYKATEKVIVSSLTGKLVFEEDLDSEQEENIELSNAKQDKLSELKSSRDTALYSTIEYNSNIFDADEIAQKNISDAKDYLSENGGTKQWILQNDDLVELDLADFTELKNLINERSSALHLKYNELKKQVNNSTSLAEVKAITWE